MIQVENLKKIYDGNTVLDIQGLQIPIGESFGLVGNNGAGKTTFFSLLLDLIEPTQGFIKNNNVIVNKSEDWKTFTTAFLDDSFLIGYLTCEEYFYFLGELRNQTKQQVDAFLQTYADFFNNEILGKNKFIRDLSKGNQKKVGIIGTLIGNPKVVILDEPFANLDPTTQIRLKKILRSIADTKQTTLLVSSHDLNHTFEISDRIVCFERGRIIKDIDTKQYSFEELTAFFDVVV
ncbi:ABC-2 type transport system ATP-binding protein [Paenimyroides ummariense]|uniref:ABC-2 type transport system ATP-binding protein n=1 Tax=Paenimyroides ummariense TaxID=913024 RepID=A0A1I4WBN3_9FLAO|nr:ABC transporter ATP-binding protein [Paenimyroides ummariense]SFN11194.1 ABC-2 type transport system ATP-binding protein [Paenimyroides ummariense]